MFMNRKSILLLLLTADLVLTGLFVTGQHSEIRLLSGSAAAGQRQEMQKEQIKKIALTFDDDVIIGLSQEIGYQEANSMI